jgi:Glycosyl hydrolase family 79 C-terminal beta domain
MCILTTVTRREGYTRGLVAGALAGVLLACAPALARAAPSLPAVPVAKEARQKALVRAKINPRSLSVPVRRNFVGVSFEYTTALNWTGLLGTGPNLPLAGLFENLGRTGLGAPVLRLGGGSQDEATWDPTHAGGHPRGVHIEVDEYFMQSLAAFLRISQSPLILGLNLASPDPSDARELMLAARSRLPNVMAYELGNEPDLYPTRRYYDDSSGRTITARPSNWDFFDWLREYRARANLLLDAADVRLAGPSTCCEPSYLAGSGYALKKLRRQIGLLTIHAYMGAACPGIGPGDPGYLTARKLLSSKLFQREAYRISGVVGQARRYNRRVRITETNSAACGGFDRVSNAFASSLWAADWFFGMAAVGASGADVHLDGIYSPFFFRWSQEAGWSAYAMPLYYGLLLFTEATGRGARLLPFATLGARVRKGSNVHMWAVRAPGGRVRIAVINKGLHSGGKVRLRVRGARGEGRLRRLLAPGVRAVQGTTFGGQSVPSGSADGRLAGAPVVETVRRRGGAYTFSLPRASAALLELGPR